VGLDSRKLLRRLQARRRALLRHYDDESLHQLRVALRRLRSLLRPAKSRAAQSLRRELGGLADATSVARDWDTLLIHARKSLSEREFHRVQPLLQARRRASHESVIGMLRSSAWTDTLHRLEVWLEDERLASSDPALLDDRISRAKQTVKRAREKAEAADDRKRWHKVRIAIKELRYVLESIPGSTPRGTLKHCKRLQDALGEWHDSVVHLQLVRELAASLDSGQGSGLHELLDNWSGQLEREARTTLDDARSRYQALSCHL